MSQSTIEYYDENAEGYDSSHARMAPLVHQKYKAAIESTVIPDGNLLDVGIGTGLSSMRYSSSHTIFGVDGSPRMLAHCAKMGRALQENLTCADLNQGKLPFNDNSFAFTISNACLVYLRDSCKIIREMVRVTQSGGIIAFDLPIHEESTTETLSYLSGRQKQRVFVPSDDCLVESFTGTIIIKEQFIGPPEQFEDTNFGQAHFQKTLNILQKK